MAFLTLFSTKLGWFGLLGSDGVVSRLWIGHRSAAEVRAARCAASGWQPTDNLSEADWWPELRRRLERYAAGRFESFDEISLAWPERTAFQARVLHVARGIPYGSTITYGELASACGHPGAARAVGNVMASNTVPIIIPCHRVVAAGGKLGGFSAPQGVLLKQRLLDLERATRVGTSADRSSARAVCAALRLPRCSMATAAPTG